MRRSEEEVIYSFELGVGGRVRRRSSFTLLSCGWEEEVIYSEEEVIYSEEEVIYLEEEVIYT